EGQRLVDADTKLLGRDERWNPAVTQAPGPAHRGLAVAADPQRHRLLERTRQHRDAIETPELTRVRHLGFLPALPHDPDRLVRAAPALPKRHAGGEELALLLDADADRGEHPPAPPITAHPQPAHRPAPGP